jgi:phage terminase large subunit-like protein
MAKSRNQKQQILSPPQCKPSAEGSNPFSSFSGRAWQYAQDVLAGRVLAGKKVKLACQRFLNDIAKSETGWRWEFDEPRANAVCTIIELFPHEKGELQGEPVRLGDWQCFIFCNLFGWVDRRTGFRRFSEALVLIPRGNGKSPMGAWAANILAWFDGEKGAEVYCAATTEDQASEVFRPAKAIVEMAGLDERCKITVQAKSMYQDGTRSRMRPVIGKPKDGKMPHGVINDEYHEQESDELYDSFKRGMMKRPQALMFNISTAGDTIEGPCYRMCEQGELILRGEYENDRLFVIIYDVDPEVNWASREALVMANPNFGVSINEERIMDDLAEAVRNSAKQNAFRCKNQNAWMQAATGWMNMAWWDACKAPIKEEEFQGYDCTSGSDLASTLDICGTVKLFSWLGGDGRARYAAFAKAYLPDAQVNNPSRPHFQAWAKDGFITATRGSSVDYQTIEDDTVEDIERYKIREVAFDPRYAGQYAQQIESRTGVEIVKIAPTPDEFSPAMKELEAAVADGRFQHDGNPVLRWCMANVLAIANQATGNYRMPAKDRPEKKIDVAIALLIAMARARATVNVPANDWDGVVTWF